MSLKKSLAGFSSTQRQGRHSMLSPILQDVKTLREQIFTAIHYRADACLELLDSLCSNTTAKSPVQLSLNPHHRRSYNSITDALSEFNKGGGKQDALIFEALLQQAIDDRASSDYHLLATDCTSSPREHSPTLADRTVVYKPNQTGLGNKPITIGHKYSTVCALSSNTDHDQAWVLPITVARVKSEKMKSCLAPSSFNTLLMNWPSNHLRK